MATIHALSLRMNFIPKAEMSNWKHVCHVRLSEKNEQQTVFFIEKAPVVNVRAKEFHVNSVRSCREH